MKLLSLVMNFAATTYLLVPEFSSSVFSSKYSNSPLRSTNDVIGTIFLVSLSSNTYVPAPHAKWMDSSYCGLLVNASTKWVTGEQLGTGNHASRGISPLVCSSILSIQSGIVIRYFSRSCFFILPVRETGWELMALTMSMLRCANRRIPPSSWAFIDLMTVGTSTTPRLALRQLSVVGGSSHAFLGL